MLGVGAPQIRTSPSTEISLIALRLMDPAPAQVLLEVDEERPQAAVVLNISRGRLGWILTTFYSLVKDTKGHLSTGQANGLNHKIKLTLEEKCRMIRYEETESSSVL